MYKNTPWIDRVVDSETQEVIQEGTNQSAANFNNMEGGITDAHIALAMLQLITGDLKNRIDVVERSISASSSVTHDYPGGFTPKNCVVISKMMVKDGIYQDTTEIKVTLLGHTVNIANLSTTTNYDVRVVLLRI